MRAQPNLRDLIDVAVRAIDDHAAGHEGASNDSIQRALDKLLHVAEAAAKARYLPAGHLLGNHVARLLLTGYASREAELADRKGKS